MSGINVENTQNAIVGSNINTGGGDVLVGANFYYSAPYQDLKKEGDELQEQFIKTRQKIEKYPDDEDFKADLLKISEKRNEVQKKLDDLKSEVIRLAETFTKIPINTERLKLARQHFEAGDYTAARAILDAEQMGHELDVLLQQKDQLKQQQVENEAHLIDNANEFLILARLTAIDFTLPDRFEKTLEYFEQSIKAAHTLDNTFAYATFLHKHNQFNTASPWYEEALAIRRTLAATNLLAYLPDVALTLNNLGLLRENQNQFPEAEAAYEEALSINRTLAEANPETYLPEVAGTLNNLGLLREDQNQFPEAEAAYVEALGIYNTLRKANSLTYVPDVALTLNNLAVLRMNQNQFPEAESAYEATLAIFRILAENNPQSYLPDVAGNLSNLAVLRQKKNQFPEAEAALEEALAIHRTLAATNPQTYLPDVARTLSNLANMRAAMNQFPEAEAACDEALGIYSTLSEANPQTYLPDVARTLSNLANMRAAMNLFPEAETTFEEALTIFRTLAEINPQTYLPDLAQTMAIMSRFYLQAVPDREKSLAYVQESMQVAYPFVVASSVPSLLDSVSTTMQVASAWGLDPQALWMEEVYRAMDG